MSGTIRVGVAGATGAVGEAVLARLAEVDWTPEVVAASRAASTRPTVAFGEDTLPVDDVADLDPGALDVLIVAVPAEAGGPLVDRAAGEGCAVVDLSGSRLADLDTPLLWPALDASALQADAPTDVVSLPGPSGLLLASVLGPLAKASPVTGVEATVLLPASVRGRAGVEELSQQVVALFNSQPPSRRVFEQGLAFDVLPREGTPRATGWTDAELRATAELARLTGLRAHLTQVVVPVFNGVSATVRFSPDDALDLDTIGRLLSASGVGLDGGADLRTIPRPRRVEGAPGVQVTRLRRTEGGVVHLWAAVDAVQAVAEATLGAAEGLLRRRGVLDAE